MVKVLGMYLYASGGPGFKSQSGHFFGFDTVHGLCRIEFFFKNTVSYLVHELACETREAVSDKRNTVLSQIGQVNLKCELRPNAKSSCGQLRQP